MGQWHLAPAQITKEKHELIFMLPLILALPRTPVLNLKS